MARAASTNIIKAAICSEVKCIPNAVSTNTDARTNADHLTGYVYTDSDSLFKAFITLIPIGCCIGTNGTK